MTPIQPAALEWLAEKADMNAVIFTPVCGPVHIGDLARELLAAKRGGTTVAENGPIRTDASWPGDILQRAATHPEHVTGSMIRQMARRLLRLEPEVERLRTEAEYWKSREVAAYAAKWCEAEPRQPMLEADHAFVDQLLHHGVGYQLLPHGQDRDRMAQECRQARTAYRAATVPADSLPLDVQIVNVLRAQGMSTAGAANAVRPILAISEIAAALGNGGAA